jgi:hypothetical protein
MNRINFVFHGRELNEFGFPVDYHSIVAFYSRLENIGVVVTIFSIAGQAINESFVLSPPDNVSEELWVESRIEDILENNPFFEGLNMQIFR